MINDSTIFTIPRFHDSTIPRFHDSTIPRFHDLFKESRIKYQISDIEAKVIIIFRITVAINK